MQYEVIIIGGGAVGLTMAAALSGTGLRTAIVEAGTPATQKDDAFDGRCISIAHTSKNMLSAIGIWPALEPYAGPIHDIYITDGNSPLFLHFDRAAAHGEVMGHMVEIRYIRRALYDFIAAQSDITLHAPAKYSHIEYGAHFTTVTLEDGQTLKAKLVIAADGKHSAIRTALGIPAITREYDQAAIVCAVTHEAAHLGVAQERFLPAGPFAILPMKAPNMSALVWTEKKELAARFMAMDDTDFLQAIQQRFGEYLGALSLASPRWSYPLSLIFAKEYTRPRLCLLGDAAHAIHPIAGQGLNLSFRDIAVLAELLTDRFRLGLDIGGATLLREYESLRKKDNAMMIAATHGLNALFSNTIPPVVLARRLGLSIVQKFPPLKTAFTQHAMGARKELPRLARGEKL